MAMDVISARESAMLLEFLLLQPSVGGNILKPLLTKFLPIHKNDPRIIQGILLQKLSSDVSFSEHTLEVLEKLEDFYYSNGIEVLDSMKEAYCAVAVHCTVMYLKQRDGLRDYFEAVVRIWRGRVYAMEKFENVGLVSSNLTEMKGVIEEVLWNESVRNNVQTWDTLGDAVRLVGVFLRDAFKEFGESRLEIVLKEMGKGDAAVGVSSRNLLQEERRGCNGGDIAVGAGTGIHGVENVECEMDVPHESVLEARETNGNDMDLDSVTEIRGGVNAECQLSSPQIERVQEGQDRNSNGMTMGSVMEIHREANATCEMHAPEVRRLHKVISTSTSDSQPVVEISHPRVESSECQLPSPQIERAQDAYQTNGNDLSVGSVSEISRTTNVRLRLPTPEVETVREMLGTSSSNLQAAVEDPHPSAAKDKYKISSPVIKRVREALRSSTLDLRAVVKDPLPDALKMAATVSASLAREGTGVQNTIHALVGVETSGNADEVRNHRAATRASLLSRNDTARTYEWSEESDSDEGSPNRPRLPTPRTITVSPLVTQDVKHNKRRKKFWSVLEEETLRKAVNEIGRGNWTRILDEHRDIFDERTAGDLKDKWRNMTK